jgi:hypothetical protein
MSDARGDAIVAEDNDLGCVMSGVAEPTLGKAK